MLLSSSLKGNSYLIAQADVTVMFSKLFTYLSTVGRHTLHCEDRENMGHRSGILKNSHLQGAMKRILISKEMI
jgi:hypothetical protein